MRTAHTVPFNLSPLNNSASLTLLERARKLIPNCYSSTGVTTFNVNVAETLSPQLRFLQHWPIRSTVG
jgi:hypothetical protein